MTILRYSLLRTMLLFGCMLTLWLVGVRDPGWLIGLTGVTSILLSYFLLKGARAEMARLAAERAAQRMRHEPVDDYERDADIEDREDDARRGP